MYIQLEDGEIGLVMAIHTFGEYLRNYHPHLHIIVADGLYNKNGTFYVLSKADPKRLEEIFRVKLIKMLMKEGLLAVEMGEKLLQWRNSGFSVYKGPQVKRDDKQGLEKLAQYIIRNPFNEDKITYVEDTGKVIYKSKMNIKTKRNFEIFDATDFLGAITQHLPEKWFQLVRYYGWYSNKKRGMWYKRQQEIINSVDEHDKDVEIISFSEYEPKRVPSKKWRELIKKIWEVDPLLCPKCQSEMKIIAFIKEDSVIEKILKHLKLWEDPEPARAPPEPEFQEVIYEPIYDDFQYCPEEYPGEIKYG